jgi:hypothetical protein
MKILEDMSSGSNLKKRIEDNKLNSIYPKNENINKHSEYNNNKLNHFRSGSAELFYNLNSYVNKDQNDLELFTDNSDRILKMKNELNKILDSELNVFPTKDKLENKRYNKDRNYSKENFESLINDSQNRKVGFFNYSKINNDNNFNLNDLLDKKDSSDISDIKKIVDLDILSCNFDDKSSKPPQLQKMNMFDIEPSCKNNLKMKKYNSLKFGLTIKNENNEDKQIEEVDVNTDKMIKIEKLDKEESHKRARSAFAESLPFKKENIDLENIYAKS